MSKQTYADNVDANGVEYETVGDNIRYGAKDAESVVKALQSGDITFDMQAIMNVLPFMDSTKKIERYEIICNGNEWGGKNINPGQRSATVNKRCYAILIGKITKTTTTDANHSSPIIYAKNASDEMGVMFIENCTNNEAGNIVEIYAVVDK